MSILQVDTIATARQQCILGTAGHIDHGKSSLVRALTGTDSDRLPDEQARGMTIELGYAHLLLKAASGGPLQIGIVDVPGHEKFIRTMVAGATGIDLAMLVIAADDGVMPQTREHVDILNLLGVTTGLIALSKTDIAAPDRIEVVKNQISQLLHGTPLGDWPVVECSAKTGAGLDRIRESIVHMASGLPSRDAGSIFRIAIDRVFTMQGRGTVVTGSILAGAVAAGTTLELMPSGLGCKAREVQSYGSAVSEASVGRRAAINITGVDREQIDRGMELATPGYLTATRYVDASVKLLARRDKPFESHQRVRVCIGTREVMAMLVIMGDDAIAPGAEALVQLRFQSPVVCAFGQRFILRNETAESTIGGGIVVRPVSRRLRAKNAQEKEAFGRAGSTDPSIRFEEAIRESGFKTLSNLHLVCQTGVIPSDVKRLRADLKQTHSLIVVTGELEVHKDVIFEIEARATAFLHRYHATHPAEPGIQRDRFITWLDTRTRPGAGRIILSRLESHEHVVSKGPYISHRDHRPALSAEDAAIIEQIIAEVMAARYDPPTWAGLKGVATLSKQRCKTLEDIARTDGRLVMFAPQHYISRSAMDEFMAIVKSIGMGRRFKLADVRDALKLNRRAVQPLLEYLDRIGFTKRVGDERLLMEPR